MITSSNYKSISDRLSVAVEQNDAVLDLVASSGSDNDITQNFEDLQEELLKDNANLKTRFTDLEEAIVSNISSSIDRIRTDFLLENQNALKSFTISLQEHVLRFNSSIDDFLSSNGIKVRQRFADLSAEAGFPIDSSNIES